MTTTIYYFNGAHEILEGSAAKEVIKSFPTGLKAIDLGMQGNIFLDSLNVLLRENNVLGIRYDAGRILFGQYWPSNVEKIQFSKSASTERR